MKLGVTVSIDRKPDGSYVVVNLGPIDKEDDIKRVVERLQEMLTPQPPTLGISVYESMHAKDTPQ